MSITHFLSPIKAIKTNDSSTIKLFVYVANIIYKYNLSIAVLKTAVADAPLLPGGTDMFFIMPLSQMLYFKLLLI